MALYVFIQPIIGVELCANTLTKLSNGKTIKQVNEEVSKEMEFNRKERSYKVLSRIADKGQGKYAYLLKELNK